MKRLDLIAYIYKPHLVETDLRALTKTFMEHGINDGVIAQYERLDGHGGFIIQEVQSTEAGEEEYERTLVYSQYMDFEVFSVTTMEDALPTILKLFG